MVILGSSRLTPVLWADTVRPLAPVGKVTVM